MSVENHNPVIARNAEELACLKTGSNKIKRAIAKEPSMVDIETNPSWTSQLIPDWIRRRIDNKSRYQVVQKFQNHLAQQEVKAWDRVYEQPIARSFRAGKRDALLDLRVTTPHDQDRIRSKAAVREALREMQATGVDLVVPVAQTYTDLALESLTTVAKMTKLQALSHAVDPRVAQRMLEEYQQTDEMTSS